MIRLLNAYFPRRTLFLGVSEWCLIALSFVAAAIVRLGKDDATVMLHYEQGFLKILMLSGVFVICMYYFDLYESSILGNRREVYARLIQALGVVCILLALVYYQYPSLGIGRGIIAIGLSLVAVILLLWRRLFLAVNSLPQFAERVLIFGDGPLAESLVAELGTRPELGLRVVGQLKSHGNGNKNLQLSSGENSGDQFLNLFESYNAKKIVVAMNERRGNLPVQTLLQLKSRGISIQDGAKLYEAVTGKLPIESLRMSWLLFSQDLAVPHSLDDI